MKTKAGVGFSDRSDSKQAGIQATQAALAQAGVKSCELVLVYSTSKHDFNQVKEGIRSVVGPGAKLVGGGAVGIITNDRLGYGGYELGVAVVSSESLKFDLFIETGLGTGEERAVGARLGKKIKEKSYVGDPNVLLMYDSVRGQKASLLNMATPLLGGMHESMKSWPNLAGVGLLGDMQFNPTGQWFDNRVEKQSAMALVMHGGVRMDTVIMHGCKPSGDYQKITKTDGAVVLEINGKPAVEAIAQLLGPNSDKSWEDYPLFITLGVNKGDKFDDFKEENYANRLVMSVDKERGGLVMFEPDLKPGMEVQLMRRSIDFEYIGKRAKDMFGKLGSRKPFLAVYIDCAGRASAYCGTDKEEAVEVQKALGGIPLLGMYSGVEVAKVGKEVQALDWTGVLCVFSE